MDPELSKQLDAAAYWDEVLDLGVRMRVVFCGNEFAVRLWVTGKGEESENYVRFINQ